MGALLFIWKDDGGEILRGYKDGLGNASHIGVYIAREEGAIHSSSSKQKVCYSKFSGKSIKGGWNRIGLWDRFDYGQHINQILNQDSNQNERDESPMLYTGIITSSNGKGANLRSKKSTSSDLIVRMGEGDSVEVLEDDGSWLKVTYGTYTGYVLKSLVAQADYEKETTPVTVTLPYNIALELRDALINAMGVG